MGHDFSLMISIIALSHHLTAFKHEPHYRLFTQSIFAHQSGINHRTIPAFLPAAFLAVNAFYQVIKTLSKLGKIYL